MRRYLSPRCLWMHLTLAVLLATFGWLTAWQLGRALAGNELSWAYTFEWPLFAAYAGYVWWQLVQDEVHGRRRTTPGSAAPSGTGGTGTTPAPALVPGWALSGRRRSPEAVPHRDRFVEQTAEEAAELAEYNRYLAGLADQDERGAHR